MSDTTAKIRLVRCPKCQGILQELPNHQVYRCGGCGATLRARIRKEESGSSETPVVNPAQANQNGSAEIRITIHKEESGSSETPVVNPAQANQNGSAEIPVTSPVHNGNQMIQLDSTLLKFLLGGLLLVILWLTTS